MYKLIKMIDKIFLKKKKRVPRNIDDVADILHKRAFIYCCSLRSAWETLEDYEKCDLELEDVISHIMKDHVS